MTERSVIHKPAPLDEMQYRRLVAASINRCNKNGVERYGLEVGCGERTMANSSRQTSSINGATLFNMLRVDLSALDELLSHFGLRVTPIEAIEGDDARLLADITKLSATFADAMTDGRIDHREEQVIAKTARPVVRELAGRIAVADRKRTV